MKSSHPPQFGPPVAKAIRGIDDLIHKLEQAINRSDGPNRPGLEELQEALSMVMVIREDLVSAPADQTPPHEIIKFASAITQLIDQLLNVIFYFFIYLSHARSTYKRTYHCAPTTGAPCLTGRPGL